jgi:3-oxoadipate enol-lactonase
VGTHGNKQPTTVWPAYGRGMADMVIRGARLHVEDTGGDDDREVILFSHGLLWNTSLFAPQVDALRERYRCIAWDHRGQGRSEVPADGDEITIEEVTADAIEFIEQLDVAPCHFVGLSMGGFVGTRIAARRPELLRSLVLLETTAEPEDPANVNRYRLLNLLARTIGVRAVLSRVAPIMVGSTVLEDPSLADRRTHILDNLGANRRSIHKAVNGVVRRGGNVDELPAIACPVTILHGEEDVAISRERASCLADGIPHATWVDVPRAGHSSTVENPDFVTAAIVDHLDRAAAV